MRTVYFRSALSLPKIPTPSRLEVVKFQARRQTNTRFSKMFRAPTVPYSILDAFSDGLGYEVKLMPAIHELCTPALLCHIYNEKYERAMEDGATPIRAVFKAHDSETTRNFARKALLGVNTVFGLMEDGETAVAFGPEIVICLAATVIDQKPDLALPEMEGLVLTNSKGGLAVAGEIRLERAET